MTAAAFRWFADIAVDVMVIEVGILGRWDATNIVNPTVAVLPTSAWTTTISLAPRFVDVATEKGRDHQARLCA